jgi:hypothetical protein
MVKNNLTYTLLIIVIVALAVSTGFFFYKYQVESKLASEKTTLTSLIVNFELYSFEYSDKVSALWDSIEFLNYTTDYTSCIARNNKMAEIQEEYNENEIVKQNFLTNISKNQNCQTAIEKFSSLMEVTKISRANSIAKTEKWCYGWHKVEWSSSWTEEYSTPVKLADTEMSANEEKLNNEFTNAVKICLKQLSK